MTDTDDDTATASPDPTPPEAPAEPVPPLSSPGGDDSDELEPQPTPDDEPEPAPDAAGLTDREIEKRLGSLEREATRHANRVSEIMGEDANDLTPCPRCIGPFVGFYFEGAPVSDEQRAAVKASIGEADPEFRRAEDARVCDACAGHGRVITGSLVPDQFTKVCPTCIGYGWVPIGAPTPSIAHGQDAVGGGEVRPPLEGEAPPDTDPWGRRPDDPDYGRLPQFARR